MSLELVLYGDEGEDDEIFRVNLTYNYSQMWALAMGKKGLDHDPPKSYIEAAPEGAVKLVQIEGMTGAESMTLLHKGIEAILSDLPAYRVLNPANGWGNADLFFQHLKNMLQAADENPEAKWDAYR